MMTLVAVAGLALAFLVGGFAVARAVAARHARADVDAFEGTNVIHFPTPGPLRETRGRRRRYRRRGARRAAGWRR